MAVSSADTQEGQDGENDHDQPDQVDDAVHEGLPKAKPVHRKDAGAVMQR
jgi:hypothetical protein